MAEPLDYESKQTSTTAARVSPFLCEPSSPLLTPVLRVANGTLELVARRVQAGERVGIILLGVFAFANVICWLASLRFGVLGTGGFALAMSALFIVFLRTARAIAAKAAATAPWLVYRRGERHLSLPANSRLVSMQQLRRVELVEVVDRELGGAEIQLVLSGDATDERVGVIHGSLLRDVARALAAELGVPLREVFLRRRVTFAESTREAVTGDRTSQRPFKVEIWNTPVGGPRTQDRNSN